MFTEDDSRRQDEAFAALVEEFDQLQAMEARMREALGSDSTFSPDELPEEVRKMGEEARRRAEQEGAARARAFQDAQTTSETGAMPRGLRRNAMRI